MHRHAKGRKSERKCTGMHEYKKIERNKVGTVNVRGLKLNATTRTFTDLFVLSASANSAVSASPILHQNVCMKGGKVRRDR